MRILLTFSVTITLGVAAVGLATFSSRSPAAAESAAAVHMFGYGPGRNMVNLSAKNVPTAWDTQDKTNVLWAAKVGSKAYALTVADGKVFVGTNNQYARNPR